MLVRKRPLGPISIPGASGFGFHVGGDGGVFGVTFSPSGRCGVGSGSVFRTAVLLQERVDVGDQVTHWAQIEAAEIALHKGIAPDFSGGLALAESAVDVQHEGHPRLEGGVAQEVRRDVGHGLSTLLSNLSSMRRSAEKMLSPKSLKSSRRT